MYGRLVRLRRPRFMVKGVIDFFRKSYGIEMDEYLGEPGDYKSLAEFFVRPLDPDKRPLTPAKNAVVSPADGLLTRMETVFEDCATQIKGKTYSLSQLIGETVDFSKGWHVAVIYLSPSNYHRYHYPVTAAVSRYLHTGARLFPVNHLGLNYIDNLFVRNERVSVELVKQDMPFYMVAVGATFVGSIKMEFMPKKHKRHRWIKLGHEVKQLQEMGRFELGSTIVLAIPKPMAEPVDNITGQPVRIGQPIFNLIN
jgi:phosphatidylserine decarboxylase